MRKFSIFIFILGWSIHLRAQCSTTISNFPYTESFENGLGQWSQSTSDNFNWTRQSGATPNLGTGPQSAPDGNFYIYADSRSPNSPWKNTALNSPCINYGDQGGGKLFFSYHIFGTSTGWLQVQISTDGGNSWNDIWSTEGYSYGDQWIRQHVDISDYAGQTFQLRFLATMNQGSKGDIAIDNIIVTSYSKYEAPQLSDENYILTRIYQKEYSTPSDIKANRDVAESITYFDGLGRPKQQVEVKASPDNSDILTHFDYDEYGRSDKTWLPISASSGNSGSYRGDISDITKQYYQSKYPADFISMNTIDIDPYSQKEIENSPLNRILQQAAPGKAWKLKNSNDDHTIKYEYQSNSENEVRLYTVNLTEGYDSPILQNSNGDFYQAGELYKTITRDENWSPTQSDLRDHSVEEFKDKQGQTVLKRTYGASDFNLDGDTNDSGEPHAILDTYYVYDDYGNLTYVLPPKSTASDVVPTLAMLSELCYQYVYDNRNRIIEKKIPGKGREYVVYNKLDQPVMTQDSILQSSNQWLFTKYDAFGRVTYTGKLIDPRKRGVIQDEANSYSGQLWVSRQALTTIAGASLYYNNNGYPNANLTEVLTMNYYDDYDFPTLVQDIELDTVSWDTPLATNVKGLLTLTQIKILGTSKYIRTAIKYDKKGRESWRKSRNELFNTTYAVASKLDFTGKLIDNFILQARGSDGDIVIIDHYDYDHRGRLLNENEVLGKWANPVEVIVENTYDELGQLKEKGVGNAAGQNRLQNIAYSYNVRGWLKGINDINSTAKLFNFKLYYNDPTNGTPLYNGNISQTQWRTDNTDSSLKTYTYSYDPLNRLTAAIDNTGNYNLSNIAYDPNGNIVTLDRNGYQGGSIFTGMDNLRYDYDSGNKLIGVTDSGNTNFGFKGSNPGNDYDYDANGNMKTDANKGITGITYNFLNLPESVTLSAGTIYYIYDATGTKLRKVAAGTTTDYDGNYIYENGNLKQFSHPEGYVEPDGSGGYDYVYSYLDHLGNVRLNYSDLNGNGTIEAVSEILDEKNYYPFGMVQKGYNNVVNGTENNYKTFQGQEINKELGLDWLSFKYRNYDPAIGRFMSVDPLAEDYSYQSPYNFAENRVMDGIELEGLEWKSVKDADGNTSLTLNVQLYNDAGLTDKQLTKLKTSITKQFAESYSNSDENITASLVIEDVSKSEGDFLVTLKEKTADIVTIDGKQYKSYKGGKTGEGGKTQKNSFDVTAKVDGSKRSNSSIARSFSHEAGHTGGLWHPWSALNTVQDIKQGAEGVTGKMIRGNLMDSDKNTNKANRSHTGTDLTKGQLKSIDKLVRKQQ